MYVVSDETRISGEPVYPGKWKERNCIEAKVAAVGPASVGAPSS